jgi:acyl phosphate:glycerol-3-phosphate acyltransferase
VRVPTARRGASGLAFEWFVVGLTGYLVGAIPFALVVGRLLHGIDVREYGTGNPGASNAYRNAGKLTGVLVILLDVAKVAVPFLVLAQAFDQLLLAVIWAAACQIGHSWPVYLRFRGGKGVAVGGGAYVAYAILLGTYGILLGILFGYGTGVAVKRPGFATIALFGIGPLYGAVVDAPGEVIASAFAVLIICVLRRIWDLPGAWNSYPIKTSLIWSVVGEDMIPGETTVGRRR